MQSHRLMDTLLSAQQQLQAKGIETARLECEMLLSHCLKCRRHELYLMGNQPLSSDLYTEFQALLDRRLTDEPVQYITGTKDFYGLTFNVDKRVLIPRFDTEVLVEYILNFVGDKKQSLKLLDLGTGSGAVSVSLAAMLPLSKIYTVDISEAALAAAKANAELNNVSDRIEFYCGDLFSPLDRDEFAHSFDVIASNPPYIPSSEINNLMPEVRSFEPSLALDGGADGLDFYRKIAEEAYFFLKPGGLVAVEMGHDQSIAVQSIFNNTGKYSDAYITKDLNGIERVAAFVID